MRFTQRRWSQILGSPSCLVSTAGNLRLRLRLHLRPHACLSTHMWWATPACNNSGVPAPSGHTEDMVDISHVEIEIRDADFGGTSDHIGFLEMPFGSILAASSKVV